ncbi:hypothetical protein [Niveispirillum cyanobacteriorum]|nr:hypothetical protein [Niveispirillum cyanobacteriorum]
MANLKALCRDTGRIEKGEWLRLYVDLDPDKDVFVLARGITKPFRDEVQRRVRQLAMQHGGDASNAPPEVIQRVDKEMYIERLLMDVKGLDDDGTPVSFERFCELLHQDEFIELWLATQKAIQIFSGIKVEDANAAAKN